MKAVSYLWIILVGSTFSAPFFDIIQHQWNIPESGWPGGAIKIAFIAIGLLLTILAVERIKRINPNDYAMIVEYPDNKWVGQSIEWRVIGEREDGYSIVHCRLTNSPKLEKEFLINIPQYAMGDSGTGILGLSGNDSDIYYEIEEGLLSSGC